MASRKKDVHLVTEKLSNLDLILRKQGQQVSAFFHVIDFSWRPAALLYQAQEQW